MAVHDQLLSVKKFSSTNAVARDTVEKAYGRLKSINYIRSVPGRGYFVQQVKQVRMKLWLIVDDTNILPHGVIENLQSRFGKAYDIELGLHHGKVGKIY